MHRALFAAVLLSVLPVTTFAMMGGQYRAPIPVYGSSGFSPDLEEYKAALRLMEKGNYADAIPHLRRVLQVRQGDPDVLTFLGFSERMVGNYPDALEHYQRALARNPDHKGARVYLGELYLALHQPDRARAQLAELARLCPDGCVERASLTQAVENYATPAPPAASAAPTPLK
jgi:tetratricopeptide (TPR) repeat protein